MKIKLLLALLLCNAVSHSQSVWNQKANFGGTARYGGIGFSIGNNGYMGLGWDGIAYKNDFWQYDPANNTWTQKANFGGNGRNGSCAFSIGNKGYVGLGLSTVTYNDFWEYDPATNSWLQKTNFPGAARYTASAFTIGGKGYIGLGTGGSSGPFYNDFYEYNAANNTWSAKASFTGAPRCGATGFSIGANGYVGMGSNITLGITYADMYMYDQNANLWVAKSNFPGAPRSNFVAFALKGTALVGTGCNFTSSIFYNDFWEYFPLSDSWIQRASLPASTRWSAVAFSIGDDGYVGMGNTSNIGPLMNDFWKLSSSCVASVSPGGTVIICSGSSTTLSATPGTGYTYKWYRNNVLLNATAQTFTTSTQGTYKCVITTGSCTITSNSVVVNVINNPTPTITAGGPTTFCAGQNVTFTANIFAGVTYQWQKNSVNIPGATAQTYTATTSGSYRVQETKGACSKYSSKKTVTVNCRLGANGEEINGDEAGNEIKLVAYPNPFTDKLQIEMTSPHSEQIEIKVMDVLGKVQYSQQISSNTASEINTQLQPGVYMITATVNGQLKTLRVVKKQ